MVHSQPITAGARRWRAGRPLPWAMSQSGHSSGATGGGAGGSDGAPGPGPAPFDASQPHLARPKLRPVRGFPAEGTTPEGQTVQMLGLADAQQISDKVVMTAPVWAIVLPLLDGSRTVDQVVSQVGRGLTRPMLEQLLAQLDDAGMLEGPRFAQMLAGVHADFDSQPVLPPGSTAAFADAVAHQAGVPQDAPEHERHAVAVREVPKLLDQWIAHALKDAADPALTALPKAIVAPHLDYARGWINYAHAYGRLRVADRPDRVIILGTNHFGRGTGVTACDKGFSTVLGACQADQGVINGMRHLLGQGLFEHRYDHEREHSIELQLPWIQHVFGKDDSGRYPAVFAALVHDPCVNDGASYDGAGVALAPFVDALRRVLAELPGRTLVVASADLSHVGPAFGDPQRVGGDEPAAVEARRKVLAHDREMLELIEQGRHAEMVSSMSWQQNPTRWCSIGCITAAAMITGPTSVRLLNYNGALDSEGLSLVTSAAMVME